MAKKSWKTPAPVEVFWSIRDIEYLEPRTAYWDGETFIAACGEQFSGKRVLAKIRWCRHIAARCECAQPCDTCNQACMAEQLLAEQRVK